MAWRAIVAAALVAIVAVVVFPSPPTANVILFDNCTFWTGADQVSVQAKHATPIDCAAETMTTTPSIERRFERIG